MAGGWKLEAGGFALQRVADVVRFTRLLMGYPL
jgi:hypothetical protein